MASCHCLYCDNLIYGRDYENSVKIADGRMHDDCAAHYNDELDAAFPEDTDEPWDGFLTDAEADADVLASAGYGTDEDYGGYDNGWQDGGDCWGD